MRILIVTQNYVPEMGALSSRLYPIAKTLVDKGHEVSVATGMPNYPAGKVFEGYRGKFFSKEVKDGCKIFRTAYFTVARNRSKLGQVLSYLSFLPAVLISGLRAGRAEVVFITSPPPFPVLPAYLLAKLRGAKLVYDIRDLWSDELVTYGGMRESSQVVKLVRTLERLGYLGADCISCTTRSLIDTVVERGAARERTFFLPNGADLELFRPGGRAAELAASLGLKNRFVVMYSGLFGIKHGLEVLIEAAKILKDRKDIVFLLLGNGARRDALEKQIVDNGLTNVILANERPITEVSGMINCADVCFAATRGEGYPRKLLSVKIFEYMACAKPVIASLEGESADVLQHSRGGIVVPPSDAKATANAILEMYEDRERGREMGIAGRQYVENHFSRYAWAAKFESMLTDLVNEREIAVPQPAFETDVD